MSRVQSLGVWISGTDTVFGFDRNQGGGVSFASVDPGLPALSIVPTAALAKPFTCDRGRLYLEKSTVFPGGGSVELVRNTTTDALFYGGESFECSQVITGAATTITGLVPASFTAGTRLYVGAETMEVTSAVTGVSVDVTRNLYPYRQDGLDNTLPKPSGTVVSNRLTFPRCAALLVQVANVWSVLDIVVVEQVTTSRTTHTLAFRSFEAILDRPMAVGFQEQMFRVNGTGRANDDGAVSVDPEGPDPTFLFGGTSADDSADLYVPDARAVLMARTDYDGPQRFSRQDLDALGLPVVSDFAGRTVKRAAANVALFSALGDGNNGTLDILPCAADGSMRCGAALHEDTIQDTTLLDLIAQHAITLGVNGQESILPWLASLCALEGLILRATAGQLYAVPLPGTQHTLASYTLASGDDLAITAAPRWQRNSVKVDHAGGSVTVGHPTDAGSTSIRFPHHEHHNVATPAAPPAGFRPYQSADVTPGAMRIRTRSIIRRTHTVGVPVLDARAVFPGDTVVLSEGTVLVLGVTLDFASGAAKLECAADRSYRRWHWSAFASGSGTSATIPLDSATDPMPANGSEVYVLDNSGVVAGPYTVVSTSGTASVTINTPITYTKRLVFAADDSAFADYGVDAWL